MAFSCVWTLLRWAFFLAILAWIIQYWLTTKTYLFSEEEVAAITKKHVGSKHEDAFRKIHSDFSKRYPGHILLTRDLQWVFVNIGGYMTSSCIVHASMTESIVFSGSPVQALGHAGWHWTNVSQTLITGNMKVWPEGTTKIVSYKPGETIHNTWGTSLGTEVAAGTWFVGYNRGFIPSAIGHAIADTIFNTHDFVTLFHTIRAYTKALWLEASHYIGQARDFGRKHST